MQTDGQTPNDGIGRACIASGGKNAWIWTAPSQIDMVLDCENFTKFNPQFFEYNSANRRESESITSFADTNHPARLCNFLFNHPLLGAFNVLIKPLKAPSNGPLYSSTVIGSWYTSAVDGWAFTFGNTQSPPRCIKCNSPPINGQCTTSYYFMWHYNCL